MRRQWLSCWTDAAGATLLFTMTPDSRAEKTEGACLLVYDGECRLCVAAKRKLEKAGLGQAGSDVRFVPYQSHEARRILGDAYRPGRPDMAFLVGPSGDIQQGLDAFLPLAPRLPAGRLLVWLVRIPFGKRAAALIYRLIARYRYRLFGEARS